MVAKLFDCDPYPWNHGIHDSREFKKYSRANVVLVMQKFAVIALIP